MKHHETISYVAPLFHAKMLICEKLRRRHAWVQLRKFPDLHKTPSYTDTVFHVHGHSWRCFLMSFKCRLICFCVFRFFSGHSLCFWQVCEAAWTLLWVRLTVIEMLHDVSWCLLCHVTCNFETSNHIRYTISNQLFNSTLGTWHLERCLSRRLAQCDAFCQNVNADGAGHEGLYGLYVSMPMCANMVSLQVPGISGQAVCLLFSLCAQHNLV